MNNDNLKMRKKLEDLLDATPDKGSSKKELILLYLLGDIVGWITEQETKEDKKGFVSHEVKHHVCATDCGNKELNLAAFESDYFDDGKQKEKEKEFYNNE